jgi:large subunit ribosomal protein L18
MAIKSKKVRLTTRQKNKFRIRKRLSGSAERPRLSVFRSGKHIYAQIISDVTGVTLASASSLDKDVMGTVATVAASFIAASEKKNADDAESGAISVNSARSSKSMAAALAVGKAIAERAVKNQIKQVVFDRNGFVYHGRIRAVAEGARMGGLDF